MSYDKKLTNLDDTSARTNRYIAKEQTLVFRALDKLGAASMERLASETGLPLIAVGYALCRMQEKGMAHFSRAELWYLAI